MGDGVWRLDCDERMKEIESDVHSLLGLQTRLSTIDFLGCACYDVVPGT